MIFLPTMSILSEIPYVLEEAKVIIYSYLGGDVLADSLGIPYVDASYS